MEMITYTNLSNNYTSYKYLKQTNIKREDGCFINEKALTRKEIKSLHSLK